MLLKINEVLTLLKISKATLYKMIAKGQFPAPKKIGKSSRWLEEDIENFVVGF